MVYLAAPYALRDALRDYADNLNQLGHICTSTWLNATHQLTPGALGTSPDQDESYAKEHVLGDIDDVSRSDVVVLFTWGFSKLVVPEEQLGTNSGGRHVETGVAMALGIPVLVVGEAENIFHRGGCKVVPDWLGVLTELRALHDVRFPVDRL